MGKITGIMNIDEYGRRQDFNITVLNFRQPNIAPMGFWASDTLHVIPSEKEIESYLYKSIQDKLFKVSTRVVRITI